MHLYPYIELIYINLLMSACYENIKMVYIYIHTYLYIELAVVNFNQHKEYLPLSYQTPSKLHDLTLFIRERDRGGEREGEGERDRDRERDNTGFHLGERWMN